MGKLDGKVAAGPPRPSPASRGSRRFAPEPRHQPSGSVGARRARRAVSRRSRECFATPSPLTPVDAPLAEARIGLLSTAGGPPGERGPWPGLPEPLRSAPRSSWTTSTTTQRGPWPIRRSAEPWDPGPSRRPASSTMGVVDDWGRARRLVAPRAPLPGPRSTSSAGTKSTWSSSSQPTGARSEVVLPGSVTETSPSEQRRARRRLPAGRRASAAAIR